MMYWLLYVAGRASVMFTGSPEAAARACHSAVDVVHAAGVAAKCVFTMGA